MFHGQHDSPASVGPSVLLHKSARMRVALFSNSRYFQAEDRQTSERRELSYQRSGYGLLIALAFAPLSLDVSGLVKRGHGW